MKLYKLDITILSIVFLSSITAHIFGMQEMANMQQYHQTIQKPGPTVILFYSPSCPVCQSFKPVFADGAKMHAAEGNFLAVDATNTEFREAVYQAGVQDVPVVVYKEVGFRNREEFNKRLDAFMGSKKPIMQAKAKIPVKPKAPVKKPAQKSLTLAKRTPSKK